MDRFKFMGLSADLKLATLFEIDYPTLRRLCITNKEMRAICESERGKQIVMKRLIFNQQ